jgi:hypothetical protein
MDPCSAHSQNDWKQSHKSTSLSSPARLLSFAPRRTGHAQGHDIAEPYCAMSVTELTDSGFFRVADWERLASTFFR